MPKHKLLDEQLVHASGLKPADLDALWIELAQLSRNVTISAEASAFLGGLSGLLQRVSDAYALHDRDMEREAQRLAEESAELKRTQAELRQEQESRKRVMDALRKVVSGLMDDDELEADTLESGSMDSLLVLTNELVRQHEASQKDLQAALADLAYQKYALDQHAIVSITDLQGHITYANDKFCDISGFTRKELLGQSHRLVNSGYHGPEFFAELWACITAGRVWRGEICNRKKDGDLYWVSATIVPLRDDRGQTQRFIAIRTDITERKQMEASVHRAREQAEAANRAKSDFLANMSHEIRTPMNGVLGMTELLLDTDLNAEQRDYLGIVKNSADALLRVINDILDFSKIEAGKLIIEHVPFDLARTLEDTRKALSLRAREKGLELRCEIDPQLPLRLVGDPGRLRQILFNLMGNALKFTHQGEVVVRVGQLPSADAQQVQLQVSVTDTGIGIAPDKLATIFEAFSQEDSSITRRFGGTGLGLTICARLTEAMGGRISVQSAPGQGSVFTFTLRMGLDTGQLQPGVPADAPAAPASVRTPVLKILLAEDHVVNQKLVLVQLARWGHQVVVADNGELAVEALKRERFDAVLMDMLMPVMDGLEATRLIRAMEAGARRTPIIAMTANAMESDRQLCLEAGMDHFLSKPMKAQDLQDMLMHATQSATASGAPDPAQAAPTVASHYAQAVRDMDPEVRTIVSQAFFESWPQDLRQLQVGLQHGDMQSVLITAHSLKGTLGMFGAQTAMEVAQQIERLATQPDSLPGISLQVMRLIREVDQLLQVLAEKA